MTANEQLITTFYQSFQKKDYKAMQDCYAGNAVFNDEVFINLDPDKVKAMWEMFCVKGKDLHIEFSNVQADENKGKAEWTARYTFAKTNRKIVNHITSVFTFSNGKIVTHNDSFNFHKWAKQAIGMMGILFGHTSFLKKKIRKTALKNLLDFMNHKKQ